MAFIFDSNRLDLVAQLAEHWTKKPKVVGSIPTVVRQNFRLPGVDILSENIFNIHQYTLNVFASISVYISNDLYFLVLVVLEVFFNFILLMLP